MKVKRIVAILISFVILTVSIPFTVASATAASDSEIEALRGTTLYVYNWGEYISDGSDDSLDVNKAFEEKYGIKVVYDTYDNNEAMYAKLNGGGVSYDIVVPSDYMIERMIVEGMVEKINFDNIPNYSRIPDKYKNLDYDPTGEYSIPYTVSYVGLIYNSKLVKEAPDSWAALWDEQYKDNILMFNNPRDAFAIVQSLLGMDYNMETEYGWRAAASLLKEQKSVNPTYVNDEVFNKMESGSAALAPYYVGDYLTMKDNNDDLEFVYPKEGVNYFVDGCCILKGTKNKLAAELYLNFLCDPEVALANAEYICYGSPVEDVYNNPEYSYYQDPILYPEEGAFKTQIFKNLSPESLQLMSDLWDEVKSYQPGSGSTGSSLLVNNGDEGEKMTTEIVKYCINIGVFLLICLAYILFRFLRNKYREKV